MSNQPSGSLTVLVRRFTPHAKGSKHDCPDCFVGADGVKGHHGEWKTIVEDKKNIFTNGGKDWIFAQAYASSGILTNGANYIGLTNDSGAPAPSDTSLASEITANGLSRAQGVYAHTPGTNTATITKTFTCTTAPQASQKAGLFNLTGPPVAGVLVNETTYGPVTLAINDQLQITWTITD